MRTLSPGHEIHWYRIESVLGQGGFGVTYLAHDTNLDRRVAIKEYLPATIATRHPDDSVRPQAEDKREDFVWGLNNFLAEARTLARFRHENIVGVHSVFEENNTAYMVMAYEQGDSLSSLYRRGDYHDQSSLERVFFPIFDGLAEIHRLGFVHRDIKPANIYIRENGAAVLLDFGSARLMVQQQTGEMTALVSQGYTPLEQYSVNYGEQGPWTDIYALAATMHEGVTGRKPDEALSRSACLLRRRPDPVSRPSPDAFPGFDGRFLDALFAGLALQPEDRPADLDTWLARFRGEGDASEANKTVLRPPVAAASGAADETVLRPPGSGKAPGATRPPSGNPAPATDPYGFPIVTENDFPLDPPTYREAPSKRRPVRSRAGGGATDDSTGAGRRGGVGRGIGVLALVLLLAGIGAGAWWFLGGAPGAPDGPAVAMPAPGLVDTLPTPREPLGVAPLETEISRRLDDMSRLAALYREADAVGGAEGARRDTLESGARALRAELGSLALEWHPQRHASLVGQIERVAALLPERIADRSALQATIGSADARSDLDAARALLEADAIVEPAGKALIDRVGRLDRDDYRALVDSPAWSRMMSALGNGALERVRAADFEAASLLVRAGLTLQPDEPFMRRLGEHLGGDALGS